MPRGLMRTRIGLGGMLAVAALALAIPTLATASAETIVVNGTKLTPDAVADVDSRTYVALRPVGQALGADVRYDPKTKEVTLTTVLQQVVFRVDDPTVTVNGEQKKIEAPARQVDGRVMLPLRGLASALGATLTLDAATHQVQFALASSPPKNAPTAPPVQSANTLEGTVTSVEATADIPSVDIDVKGLSYTVTVPPNTKVQFRDTHGGVAGEGLLGAVKPGDTLIATLDQQGRVLSIADVFSGTSGTITSVAGQNMVLTNGHVITMDDRATAVTLDGSAATISDLRAGDVVTVRSDPRTGKVREVVAFSPGASSTTPASATPAIAAASSVQIGDITANAAHPLRAGQSLNISFDGTPGGTATFDLSNVVQASPMHETRPGHYEGSYIAQIGMNITDAPILVTLSKGGQSAHAVGPQPLNIITDPPQVKTTAPSSDARINTLRPSIYVTFLTVGGKGMNADSLELTVDGKDVTSQSTRTGAFVSYFPATDLHEGRIDVRVHGADVAGNPLDYSWSFVISTK